jgi:endoglucanase
MRGNKLHGRACDDLIGVASILSALIEVKRDRAPVNVAGVLTRAEEVGFHGALALAGSGKLRRNSLVISLETSREIPPVKMGAGVIVRVGDRASVFDSEATRFLSEVASRLAGADRTFAFQRALMSGGTCEATAFQEFGYQTAAVCVALGNYHNCAPNNRIAAEYVSATDCVQLVKLMVESARAMPQYAKLISALPERLTELSQVARNMLPRRL